MKSARKDGIYEDPVTPMVSLFDKIASYILFLIRLNLLVLSNIIKNK